MRTLLLVLIIATELGTTLITACRTAAPTHSDDAGSKANPAYTFDVDMPESGGIQSSTTDRNVYDPEPSVTELSGLSNPDRSVPEDSQKNARESDAVLAEVRDTEPPVISGAADQTIFIGDSISYRSGVAAYDDADGAIDFSVDSSAVNIYEIGEYDVVYSAVDSSGNTAYQHVTISVIDPNTDAVYAIADDILAAITTPDMSLLQKAQRIHSWIRGNITYTGSSEKTNAIAGAYSGFRTRQGDCFTFYSVSEVLLTRAGIPNMRVTRVGGYTSHYWNLINVGTGWYHFDANPTRERINNFMFTSVQAEEFTRLIEQVPNYYVYDKSLYPTVVGDVADNDEPTGRTAMRFLNEIADAPRAGGFIYE